ncbi:MAG TPA: CBS domain-containing protein [Actinomycetota bacterium]|nr:CBS domain-containing protein [Actinomycetota bacterium]
MAQSIREVMTKDPITLDSGATITEAARAMRDSDVGNVIVLESGKICGIVTDRDITVRAVAEGRAAESTRLGDICTRDITTISPDDSVDDAARLMREKAIRRLPVVENDQPVGIVALGDLADGGDAGRTLEGISEAPPNN